MREKIIELINKRINELKEVRAKNHLLIMTTTCNLFKFEFTIHNNCINRELEFLKSLVEEKQ